MRIEKQTKMDCAVNKAKFLVAHKTMQIFNMLKSVSIC